MIQPSTTFALGIFFGIVMGFLFGSVITHYKTLKQQKKYKDMSFIDYLIGSGL